MTKIGLNKEKCLSPFTVKRIGHHQVADKSILIGLHYYSVAQVPLIGFKFGEIIERVSIECRKTKTKVITLANQKGWRQSGKPFKTRSNYTQPTQSAEKCARASHDWFWFHF